MQSRSTAIILAILVGLGLTLMAVYIWWYGASRDVRGTYQVADVVVDTLGVEHTSILFVEVAEYDSLHLLKVAEALTRRQVEQRSLDQRRRRTYLYHFFVPGDTAVLSQEMIDEVQYRHPALTDPTERLLQVPHGWIVRAVLPADHIHPELVEAHQVAFTIPRPGLRARDVQ
jgi:hypothetical protein